MKITPLNARQLTHFVEKGCAVANQCYANCARIVYGLGVGNYILCRVTDSLENWHRHAVLEIKGDYFDPTLQQNTTFKVEYNFFQRFTRDELMQFMNENGASFKDGVFTGWPPALLDDNSIQCIQVGRGA